MLILNAKIKNISKNKKFNKQLRLNNNIPAIIYGKNIKSINIIIEYKSIIFLKNKYDFEKNIKIKINDLCYLSKIKDIQVNLIKNKIIHIDFLVI